MNIDLAIMNASRLLRRARPSYYRLAQTKQCTSSSKFMKDLKDFRDSRTKGPITFYTLGFTLITAVGIVAMYNIEKDNKTKALSKNITTTGKPALGGPWVLVDQDGIPRSDASYFGQFTLLYFGFTYCPDICPSELVKIGDIMKAIGNYDQQHFTSNYYSLSSSYHTTREIKRYSVEASAYLRGPL